jgi:antitoxin MazE
MQTRVQKWGDSLVLPIPGPVAGESGLAEQSLVDVAIVDGKLIVTPLPGSRPTLEELLRRVTPDNLHSEVDTGPSVGAEAP